jgi:pyruvate kinase
MRPKRHLAQRTKIVCTIGPASGTPDILKRLIDEGMNVARLNLSHGSEEEHTKYVRYIRGLERDTTGRIAILMDLPGPKYRTGDLAGGSLILKNNSMIVLSAGALSGDEKMVPVNLPNFHRDVRPGNMVLIDDGAMQLKVKEINGTEVLCKVISGGVLTPGRGIVVPGMRITSPFITDALKEKLGFAVRNKPDYIALSFVSRPEDVEQVRILLKRKGSNIPLISKIERGEAVDNFDKILAVSDGIMVARGDMGVEIPLKRIPSVQKEIILKCNRAGKPVITATQMLESMVNAPLPTRAEVTDVANAILDGTDAIMLSAETSVGKYPVPTVKMMSEIARETESHLPYEMILKERGEWLVYQTDELISYNACHIAHWLKAAAIVAFTQSGSTARRVSKYRPCVPIIALTPEEEVSGRLVLQWGVQAFCVNSPSSVEGLFKMGANLAKELGLARPGDLIVITGGIPVARSGSTNLLKVEEIT